MSPNGPGAAIRGAFVDLKIWMGRAHGALTYRITQVLTGHGIFESYLFKIRRQDSICLFCRAVVDTAAHTLLFCTAWTEQRRGLLEFVEVERTFRTFRAMVGTIMRSPEACSAFANFCETVMRRKEENERAREQVDLVHLGMLSPPNLHSSDEEL